ncbi:MAG: hypothetical protein ACREPQ_02670 [Rhodanobacter sp.]
MKELTVMEVEQVSGGGLSPAEGGVAIIALGLMGGPFTMAFGLTVGIPLLFE